MCATFETMPVDVVTNCGGFHGENWSEVAMVAAQMETSSRKEDGKEVVDVVRLTQV